MKRSLLRCVAIGLMLVLAGCAGGRRTSVNARALADAINSPTPSPSAAPDDLGVCTAKRVEFTKTDPGPGEYSAEDISKGADHVTLIVHGLATIGTADGQAPSADALAKDAEGVPISDRSVWVIVQDGIQVHAMSQPTGAKPVPAPGETPSAVSTPEPSVFRPSVNFTAQAWVRDAKTGEQLQGWTCASEESQPDGTWVETRGVDGNRQTTRRKSAP